MCEHLCLQQWLWFLILDQTTLSTLNSIGNEGLGESYFTTLKYCSSLNKVPPHLPPLSRRFLHITMKTSAAMRFAALTLTVKRKDFVDQGAAPKYYMFF